MRVEHAVLENTKDNKKLEVQFNPETIGYTHAANWTRGASAATAESSAQFVGNEPVQVTLDVLLDNTMRGGRKVAANVNMLSSWATGVKDQDEWASPLLTFQWGSFRIGKNEKFKCHLRSIQVAYTLFDPTGEPLRAKCSLTLKGAEKTDWGQNPTSGALEPAVSGVVQADESIFPVIFNHFRSTKRWRDVAEFNNVDNPFRIPAGTAVVLPNSLRKARRA